MRKKVSFHQTHQLPLLQRVPAQKLDETRHLRLNLGPTALLAQAEDVCFESLSSVWCLDRNSQDKLCKYISQCSVLATRPNVSMGLYHAWRCSTGWPQCQVRRLNEENESIRTFKVNGPPSDCTDMCITLQTAIPTAGWLFPLIFLRTVQRLEGGGDTQLRFSTQQTDTFILFLHSPDACLQGGCCSSVVTNNRLVEQHQLAWRD